jgi:hypothetical protein
MLISKGTLQLIKEYTGDNYCLELLNFFGRYPSAHFNRLAIIYAMNNTDNRREIEKALKRLVENKLIDSISEKGTTLYSLTSEKVLRDIVLNIASLDLPRRQALFNNKDVSTTAKCDDNSKKTYEPLSFARPVFYEIH